MSDLTIYDIVIKYDNNKKSFIRGYRGLSRCRAKVWHYIQSYKISNVVWYSIKEHNSDITIEYKKRNKDGIFE